MKSSVKKHVSQIAGRNCVKKTLIPPEIHKDCAKFLKDLLVNEDIMRKNCESPKINQLSGDNLIQSTNAKPFIKYSKAMTEAKKTRKLDSGQIKGKERVCTCCDSKAIQIEFSALLQQIKAMALVVRDVDLEHLAIDAEAAAQRIVQLCPITPSLQPLLGADSIATQTFSCAPTWCRNHVEGQLVRRNVPRNKGIQTNFSQSSPLDSKVGNGVDAATQHTGQNDKSCETSFISHPDTAAPRTETSSLSVPRVNTENPKSLTHAKGLSEEQSTSSIMSSHTISNCSPSQIDNTTSQLMDITNQLAVSNLCLEKERQISEKYQLKSEKLETSCQICQVKLKAISLQLSHRQADFEKKMHQWNDHKRDLQNSLNAVNEQARGVILENDHLKKRLEQMEVELDSRKRYPLEVANSKPSVVRPIEGHCYEQYNPSQTSRAWWCGSQFRHFSSVIGDAGGGDGYTQTTIVSTPSSYVNPEPFYHHTTPVNETCIYPTEVTPRGDANDEINSFLDEDTVDSVSTVGQYRKTDSQSLLNRSIASVSTLKSVDVSQFRSGLSALDAEIAKLRLSLAPITAPAFCSLKN